jgi:hypothetical protein
MDKDSEPEDENDGENKNNNQELQWYFNCGSNLERNQILSQLCMNAKNEQIMQNNQVLRGIHDQEQILEDWINKQEAEGI